MKLLSILRCTRGSLHASCWMAVPSAGWVDCIRNGSSNTGAQAAAHLRRKLDATRDQLGTTAQFIDYVASKSSTSGKPYEVHCPGQPQQLAQAWLHQLRQSK